MDYRSEAPKVLRDFLTYHETIKGHSPPRRSTSISSTCATFFRFIKIERGIVPRGSELEDVSIDDIDLEFAGSVTTGEVYDYLSFLARDKVRNEQSRSPE